MQNITLTSLGKALGLTKLTSPNSQEFLVSGNVISEPGSYMIIGATSAAKCYMLTQLLDQIEERGEKAIVVDAGGEFCKRYYQEGRDYVLNPFDDRCIPWNPVAEITNHPTDFHNMARSMIPEGHPAEKYSEFELFLTTVIKSLKVKNQLSLQNLLYYVKIADYDELVPLLQGTEASFLLDSNSLYGHVRTWTSSFLCAYCYFKDSENPFSIRKFVTQDTPGFLFITYTKEQLDSLRNVIACALNTASLEVLGQDVNNNRKTWLIFNNFTELGQIQSLKLLTTRIPQKAAYLVLSTDSMSELTARYGEISSKIMRGASHKLKLTKLETLVHKTEAFIPRDFKEKPMLQLTQ